MVFVSCSDANSRSRVAGGLPQSERWRTKIGLRRFEVLPSAEIRCNETSGDFCDGSKKNSLVCVCS